MKPKTKLHSWIFLNGVNGRFGTAKRLKDGLNCKYGYNWQGGCNPPSKTNQTTLSNLFSIV